MATTTNRRPSFQLRRHRSMLAFTLLLTGLVLIGGGLGLSQSRTEARTAQDGAVNWERAAANLPQASDGDILVVDDPANGAICVTSRLGGGSGASCTRADALDPMLAVHGPPNGPVAIAAVDPQRRLGSMIVNGLGEAVGASSQDAGLSIELVLPANPVEVVLLDTQGNVLAVHSTVLPPEAPVPEQEVHGVE